MKKPEIKVRPDFSPSGLNGALLFASKKARSNRSPLDPLPLSPKDAVLKPRGPAPGFKFLLGRRCRRFPGLPSWATKGLLHKEATD